MNIRYILIKYFLNLLFFIFLIIIIQLFIIHYLFLFLYFLLSNKVLINLKKVLMEIIDFISKIFIIIKYILKKSSIC